LFGVPADVVNDVDTLIVERAETVPVRVPVPRVVPSVNEEPSAAKPVN
jgi:hypothetical protein